MTTQQRGVRPSTGSASSHPALPATTSAPAPADDSAKASEAGTHIPRVAAPAHSHTPARTRRAAHICDSVQGYTGGP
ncbi:hypothetical protein A0H81_13966 [Grifola frondosa]|uniref:Uncharacterized protein n=1 Tax=Grifola frondosa TaxID=5627 RepID=A0A1C7LMS8_GRIFR|nr:hypothetical protein A0H81_13966 [Grifola frondosa]